jgi:hypothetical protein
MIIIRLWLDDVRPAPEGYYWVERVEDAIYEIKRYENECDSAYEAYVLGNWDMKRVMEHLDVFTLTEISCDNDLGEGEAEGYKLLDWLEFTNRNYPIHIHSANPVAVQRMRSVIERNGWKEIR